MLAAVTLDDKYVLDEGRIYLTGIQALVRLPQVQRRRDLAAGLDTAGFVSGYRGSPLAAYDRELWRAKPRLEAHRIHFQPGVNEDLAATALWGSQQATLDPLATCEGVFGLWYGKGPGLDRSGDAMKHGNFAGSDPLGGVLALAGDDHGARSSTLAHQSDHAFIHFAMPVLNPAGVAELLDYGLLGLALSRFAGCWVGLKCITDIVESGATVRGRPRAPGDRPARRFRDARRRAQHPCRGHAARPGGAGAGTQARRGARLRRRQPHGPGPRSAAAIAAWASSPAARPTSMSAPRSPASASTMPAPSGSASASTRWPCRGRSSPRASSTSVPATRRSSSSRRSGR